MYGILLGHSKSGYTTFPPNQPKSNYCSARRHTTQHKNPHTLSRQLHKGKKRSISRLAKPRRCRRSYVATKVVGKVALLLARLHCPHPRKGLGHPESKTGCLRDGRKWWEKWLEYSEKKREGKRSAGGEEGRKGGREGGGGSGRLASKCLVLP
jgi:hypothetical protein